jgi:hypothetical protein
MSLSQNPLGKTFRGHLVFLVLSGQMGVWGSEVFNHIECNMDFCTVTDGTGCLDTDLHITSGGLPEKGRLTGFPG